MQISDFISFAPFTGHSGFLLHAGLPHPSRSKRVKKIKQKTSQKRKFRNLRATQYSKNAFKDDDVKFGSKGVHVCYWPAPSEFISFWFYFVTWDLTACGVFITLNSSSSSSKREIVLLEKILICVNWKEWKSLTRSPTRNTEGGGGK